MATDVFYSVSPRGTSDDLKVASNLTISSGVATFTVAQTGNIGKGLRVTYDTSKVAFISAVNSSTSFDLVTITGGTPSDEGSAVTVNSIKHEYASLSAAEAGFTDASHINNTSLVAADTKANLVLYYDDDDATLDTTAVTIAGTTTDATRFINIFAANGGTDSINVNKHQGAADLTTAYCLQITDSDGIFISDEDVTLDGIQHDWNNTSGTYHGGIEFAPGSGGAGNCITKNYYFNGNSKRGFGHSLASTGTGSVALVQNCIVYDLTAGSSRAAYRTADTQWTANHYHCLAENCGTGFAQTAGTANAIGCIAANNTSTSDFVGTFNTIDYCASDDGDGTNAVGPLSSDWDNEFTNLAGEDYSLKSGGNCFEGSAITNADDSNVPTVDIAGNARNTSGGTNTSIGPFANGEGGGGGDTTNIYFHLVNMGAY